MLLEKQRRKKANVENKPFLATLLLITSAILLESNPKFLSNISQVDLSA